MCLGMNPDILDRGRALRLDLEPQLRGPPGQGRAHPPGQPEDGRGGRDRGPLRRHQGLELRMRPLDVIEGKVSVLDRADVDTDQIIPKQFLKRVERTGFGEFLFYDWIRDGEIELEPNPILVTGRNFGCGSSREHAPWALEDFGFEAIVAPVLRRHLLRQLHQDRAAAGDPRRGALPGGRRGRRGADRRRRPDRQLRRRASSSSRSSPTSSTGCCNGLDDIGITLENAAAIDAFEASGAADRGPVTTALCESRGPRPAPRLGRGELRPRLRPSARSGRARSSTGSSWAATRRVLDAGCGTGRVTALLLERLPRGPRDRRRRLAVDDRRRRARSCGRGTTALVADLRRARARRAGRRRLLQRRLPLDPRPRRPLPPPARGAAPGRAARRPVRRRGQRRAR